MEIKGGTALYCGRCNERAWLMKWGADGRLPPWEQHTTPGELRCLGCRPKNWRHDHQADYELAWVFLAADEGL